MFELKGKVALVTGGASGIGLAYVKELLRNELKGVAILDINDANGQSVLTEITKEFGDNRAIFVLTNVCDRRQFEAAFETVVKTFNQLDIVINNAGIIQEIDWEKCVAVNLTGVITGCMLAMDRYLPKYRSGSEGVIVNTASVAGLVPVQQVPTYAATKFGVVGLTRSLGSEMRYRETKVRVVGICPGTVDTTIINVNESQVPEPYLTVFTKQCSNFHSQTPESLARNVLNVIKEAPTGSIWMALTENNFKQVEFSKYWD